MTNTTKDAPPDLREQVAREALKQARRSTHYPDYLDDPEGFARLRESARTKDGHAFTACNNNSVWRLVETIERLQRAVDIAASFAAPPAGRLEDEQAVIDAARDLVMRPGGLVNRGVGIGLVVVEKADKSDPHYRLCTALERQERFRQALSLIKTRADGAGGNTYGDIAATALQGEEP